MCVDGFLAAVPKDRLEDYRAMAELAATVWMEHGALSVVEAQADDLADDVTDGERVSFPKAVQLKPDEVLFFSWITYHDRAQRDAVNAKVMADPRTQMPEDPPFRASGMLWGGFQPVVNKGAK